MVHSVIQFRCPSCKSSVDPVSGCCSGCQADLRSDNGVLDFVRDPKVKDERAFYDDEYNKTGTRLNKGSVDSTESIWSDPWQPQQGIVLQQLGDIQGKRILLIGNGHSTKELHLLTKLPKTLIYSDLSPTAVGNIRDRFELESYSDTLYFAAIDANHIPLFDNSIDIVYAYAIVHHLPQLDMFFSEVNRVLVKKGRAIFMDDANSPIWHFAKQTFLRPLMKYSHKSTGISPEDYRFSMSGGFRERELGPQLLAFQTKPWFIRTCFFQYLWFRGYEKLCPRTLPKVFLHRHVARLLLGMDKLIARIPLLKNNMIRLIWGFDKND